jgi:hypothetical protein
MSLREFGIVYGRTRWKEAFAWGFESISGRPNTNFVLDPAFDLPPTFFYGNLFPA